MPGVAKRASSVDRKKVGFNPVVEQKLVPAKPSASLAFQRLEPKVAKMVSKASTSAESRRPTSKPNVCVTDVSDKKSPDIQNYDRPHIADRPSDVPLGGVHNYFVYEKKVIPDESETKLTQFKDFLRKGPRNLIGYFRGRIKAVADTFTRDASWTPDPPVYETHELVDATDEQAQEQEVYKVWKHKAETSKMVTRDDGLLYQKISQYVWRNVLATPRGTSCLLEPSAYTGKRITEGTYESGEKFTDTTPWFPHKGVEETRNLEARRMKERWRGDYYLQLTSGYLDQDSKDEPDPNRIQLSEKLQEVSPTESDQLDRTIRVIGRTKHNGCNAVVTKNAKHLIIPDEDLPGQLFSCRHTFVQWDKKWHQLVDDPDYLSTDNPQRSLSHTVPWMVTLFMGEDVDGSDSEASDTEDEGPNLVQYVELTQKPCDRYTTAWLDKLSRANGNKKILCDQNSSAQVLKNAQQLQLPDARTSFSQTQRSTYVRKHEHSKWFQYEDRVHYTRLKDKTEQLTEPVFQMVTVFHRPRAPMTRALRFVEICTATMQMTVSAIKKGWTGCTPITIETNYDLLTPSGRTRGFEALKKANPDAIMAEWPCDPHSNWVRVNRGKGPDVAKRLDEKQALHRHLIAWIAKVEKWQRTRGKIFIGEQPAYCGSWNLPETQEMQKQNFNTYLDMCQFDLKDPFNSLPYRHRTKLVHNSHALHKALSKLCPGKHEHEVTQGATKYKLPDGTWKSIDRTKFAGWYTEKFCDAVIDALNEEFAIPASARVAKANRKPFLTLPTVLVDPEAPYNCPECGHPFYHHGTMQDHRVQHHGYVKKKQRPRDPDATRSVRPRLSAPTDGRERENTPPSTVENDSTPIPGQSSEVVIDPTAGAAPGSAAPFMPLDKPVTEDEARAAGFSTVDEWKDRTLEAQSLGMTYILARPHEHLVPRPVPASATTPETAASEPTLVPPNPGEAATQQTPLTSQPQAERSDVPRVRNPRMLKGLRRALGMTASQRQERRTGYTTGRYAGGQAHARSTVRRIMQEMGYDAPDTQPVASTGAFTSGLPEPESLPQSLGPSVPSHARPPDVASGHDGLTRVSPGSSRRAPDLRGYPSDIASHLQCEDFEDYHPESDLVVDEDDLPPEARRVPKNVKRMIRNAHRNLGHPSNFALVRLMKTARCSEDLIAYARHMKCPTCARRNAPGRMPRVTTPYRPTRFNSIVGMDLKEIKDSKGTSYYCLNILDLATTFNVFVLLPNKTSLAVAKAYQHFWLNWAGVPDKVVTDKGKEFYGDFQEVQAQLGTRFKMIPVEAPWQNGMVERHGGVLGDIVHAVVAETGAVGYSQMRDVCLHASMSKNRRPGKTGYSPRSLVFGVDERLAVSGLNHYLEEPDDAAIANAQKDPQLLQSLQFRKQAMKAVIDLDHSTKWAEAIKFPSRPVEVSLFLPGHQVAFWKKAMTSLKGRAARSIARWRLGVIIGHEWDHNHMSDSYWISSEGRLFLVPGQHVRHAEMEEVLSREAIIAEAMKTMRNLSAEPEQVEYYDFRDPRGPDPPGTVYEGPPPATTMFPTGADQPLLRQPIHDDDEDEGGIPHSSTMRIAQQNVEAGRNAQEGRSIIARILPPDSRVPAPRASSSSAVPDVPADAATASGGSSYGLETPLLQSPPPEVASVENTATPDAAHALITSICDDLPTEVVQECRGQECFYIRCLNKVLVADHETNEVMLLKWKTFKKNQRKGRELDSKFFNEQERKAFSISDSKEWQSFLDTGAVVVIPPEIAKNIPKERVFKRAARYVRTNKSKKETELIAKSRIVVPGDVDPDGDIAVEEGGFRTDAPTAPQLAFHLLCSNAVRRKWRLRTFDVKTAFLSGKQHNREIYMRPPPEGLPGVPPGSLLKIVKGAYGLREAPRLWYLKAREVILSCGFEELQTARACFVLRDKTKPDAPLCGMMVLHVDDACYGGQGDYWKSCVANCLKQFHIGNEEEGEFDFLGRHVKQLPDFSIEIDQHQYCQNLQRVFIPRNRRNQPKSKLTPDELHEYRSIVGQLAWPARESMPQLAYGVSDLQQKTSNATIHDLVHANNVLGLAKRWAETDKQKLVFRPFTGDVSLNVVVKETNKKAKKQRDQQRMARLGIGAVHDASFMQQPQDGSQYGYLLMLAPVTLFDEPTTTHLLDWSSAKIHRKVRSTLAAEASGGSRAYDRAMYARAMIYEIECGKDAHWTEMCKQVPFCLGTDCKSLFDLCSKVGSLPDERRVALDLLDVREGIEEMKDQIRWVPTDHMLADAFTKSMPPDLLLKYLKDGKYSFKYDDVIKNTKREQAKARSAARQQASGNSTNMKDTDSGKRVGLRVNCVMWNDVLDIVFPPNSTMD